MDMDSLKHRLHMVRNAEFNAHAQRMCVVGYIGAMLEMSMITWTEYQRISAMADNACAYRRKELSEHAL